MRTIYSRPRLLLHAAVLAAAGLTLAACGSGDDAEANSDESASAGGDMLAAYIACIEEQGIELPDDWTATIGGGGGFDPENAPSDMPTNMPTDMSGELPTDMPSGAFGSGFEAPEGVSNEDWQAAQEACSSELPMGGGGFPGGEAPASSESDDLASAYRDCLDEHGVELGEDVTALDASDPDVAAAMEECAALAPASDTGS